MGVVGDEKYTDLREKVQATVYTAFLQNLDFLGAGRFEVRTAGNPNAMIPAVWRAVQEFDRNLPIFDVKKTQVEQIDQALFQERHFAKLSSFFGFLALALASVGLYGITTHAITRRANGIGIRLALRAHRLTILRAALGEALGLVAIAIAIGTPAAVAASRLTSAMPYGPKPADSVTLGSVALVMAVLRTMPATCPRAGQPALVEDARTVDPSLFPRSPIH